MVVCRWLSGGLVLPRGGPVVVREKPSDGLAVAREWSGVVRSMVVLGKLSAGRRLPKSSLTVV
jgi:hypothetical protein